MAAIVSTQTARSLGLLRADFIWVHHGHKKRAFMLRYHDNVDNNVIVLSKAAQANLSTYTGAQVRIRNAKLPTVRVCLVPCRAL
jgi:hypothetical protein